MFDVFLPVNPSWLNCSFCLILYLLMIVLTMRFKVPYYNRNVNVQVSWFLIFVFYIFSFCFDDWFSYFEHINSVKYNLGNINNITYREALEPIYYYIIFAINGDYLLWRLIIFGPIVILSYYTGKRLCLNKYSFLMTFALIATPILSYARVSLAMAMAFYGLSFFIKPHRSLHLLSYLFGCALVIFSVFFHKSALVLPLFVFVAYIFRITRLKMVFIFSVFLAMLIVLNTTDFMTIFLSGEDVQTLVSERASKYLSSEKRLGIGKIIIRGMNWVSYYLFALLALKLTISKSLELKLIRPYANSIILIVLFATMFLFTSNFNAFTLYYRFMNFATIPITIFAAYCIHLGIWRKALIRVTLLCTLSHILNILYSTYSSYILYD